jgi:hypothetical protein
MKYRSYIQCVYTCQLCIKECTLKNTILPVDPLLMSVIIINMKYLKNVAYIL